MFPFFHINYLQASCWFFLFSLCAFSSESLPEPRTIKPLHYKPVPQGVFFNCQIPNAIALTYDDGPNIETTTQILDCLKENSLKATFFVTGKRLEDPKKLAVMERAIKEGHSIGNHSWSHPDFTTITPERIRQEIEKTDEMISRVLGKVPIFFRPPYGEFNEEVLDIVVREKKKKVILWNLDTNDWKPTSTCKTVLKEAFETLSEACSSCHSWIILQHDIQRETATTQKYFIRFLKHCGYRFVTMEEALALEK